MHETVSRRRNAAPFDRGEKMRCGGNIRAARGPSPRMNSKTILLSPRALAAVSFLGLGSAMILEGGCARRPIIVQAPPATVIQSPSPAPEPTGHTTPAVVIMHDPPPSPRFEQPTPQPSPETTWIPGYWFYRDGEQQWVSGHWDTPPRVGAVWIAPRWEKQGDGYVFIQGYWQ